MKRFYYLIISVFLCINVHSAVKISGYQYGEFPTETYEVNEDIVVEKDRVLIFEKGTVLKFNEYTGVKVYGKLICKGEKKEPVKFTSANDSTLWNGVEVFENGKIEIGDVIIEKSLSGISINDSSNIEEFSDIILYENDDNSIKIGDAEIILSDDKPFTIENVNIYNTNNNILSTPQGLVKEKKSVGIIIARYCFAGLALGGLAMWVYYNESAEHYKTKYELDKSSSADDYRIKYSDQKKLSNIGKGITLGALPMLAFSITIDDRMFKRIKNRKKR